MDDDYDLGSLLLHQHPQDLLSLQSFFLPSLSSLYLSFFSVSLSLFLSLPLFLSRLSQVYASVFEVLFSRCQFLRLFSLHSLLLPLEEKDHILISLCLVCMSFATHLANGNWTEKLFTSHCYCSRLQYLFSFSLVILFTFTFGNRAR